MIGKEFSVSDFENLHLSKCDESLIYEFLKSINNETIGRKISRSLNQRKQGHFDKAMLNISEANRDQVLAIRAIQSILDKLESREKTEVIFEKYRQILPFQIGLTNGEEVLNFLTQIKLFFGDELPKITSNLYDNEEKVSLLIEELTFFEERGKGKITQKEIDIMRDNILTLIDEIQLTKKLIVTTIFNSISEKNSLTSSNDMFRLIKNAYLITTSSMETLDAKLIEV